MSHSASSHTIDTYFTRNTIGISTVEMLWGLGLPVVMESTFLQIFLHSLGASNLLIGLIPTLFFSGVSLFSLFSGFLTAHLKKKQKAVILLHLFASLPILILGITLRITGFTQSTLSFFFVTYGLFSVGIGLILPTWQNYLVSIYSDKKIISGHSFMWISQSVGKFFSGFVILKIISKYSFSVEGASLIFSLVGIIFILGSFMFLLTRESVKGYETNNKIFFKIKLRTFRDDLHKALHNRHYLFFLASGFEQYAVISIISFYANYAIEYCSVQPKIAAGAFVILSYSGSIIINIIFGRLDHPGLKGKYMAAKIISLAAVVILYHFTSLWAFFAASFLFGVSRGARSLVYSPSIKRISGQKDSTTYFGLAPLLVMPLSTGLPLLAGTFLDRFSSLGAESYRLLFLGMGTLVILGIFFLSKVHIDQAAFD